jgi:hypothetical protein
MGDGAVPPLTAAVPAMQAHYTATGPATTPPVVPSGVYVGEGIAPIPKKVADKIANIGSNCHKSSVAATEIDIRNLPCTDLPIGLLKYGIPQIRMARTYPERGLGCSSTLQRS